MLSCKKYVKFKKKSVMKCFDNLKIEILECFPKKLFTKHGRNF